MALHIVDQAFLKNRASDDRFVCEANHTCSSGHAQIMLLVPLLHLPGNGGEGKETNDEQYYAHLNH